MIRNPPPKHRNWIIIGTCLIAAFVAGALTYKKAKPVYDTYQRKDFLLATFERSDALGRLVSYPNKLEVECPKQTDNTAVILIIGQSNSANYGGQRHRSKFGNQVINFFKGRCYISSSPLLGASGFAGESFTLLGNKLIESQSYDRVILVPGGQGGYISHYAPGGGGYKQLQEALMEVTTFFKITDIIFHQGEGDYAIHTTEEDYRDGLLSLIKNIRAANVSASFYVPIATKCGLPWERVNPIATAQASVINSDRAILAGVDTDDLILDIDRHDGCHFGGSGIEKFASAMRDVLVSSKASSKIVPTQKHLRPIQ